MRATEHAPGGPFRVLERCHGLAEIIECGARVLVERPRVTPPHHLRSNKWWEILYQMNIADGALLNETAWSALVGMSKKNARDAAKAELAAE